MIIGFDPVARALIVDAEDGRPPMEIPAERFLTKWYADGGIFYVGLGGDGRDLRVDFVAVDDEGDVADLVVGILRTAPGTWYVRFGSPAPA